MDTGGLIVRSRKPLNVETPPDRLCGEFFTDPRDFYVRSHAAEIPVLDPAHHAIEIDGLVTRRMSLRLSDLRQGFAGAEVTATMQCAGNRRAALNRLRKVSGTLWESGAIGTARWGGVRLADLLRAAGVVDIPGLHVVLTGADEITDDGASFHYGASIPLAKALSPEVLVAWSMAGAFLSPQHGAPLRAIVPGFAGVRSVKWLSRITVSDQPADTPIQRTDYKLVPAHITAETVDWENATTIDEMPLNAAIASPATNDTVEAGMVEVEGWAIAGSRRVARVELSADGGASWQVAELRPSPADAGAWAWTLWRGAVWLTPGKREIAVRAWDSAGQTQPATTAEVWNFKGYLNNAWHRVALKVV